jgi:hypothetical protein
MIMVITSLFSLVGCKSEDTKTENIRDGTIVYIKYNEDVHEVYQDSSGNLKYKLNGEDVKDIDIEYLTSGIMSLSDTTDTTDSSSFTTLTTGVYESNILQTTKYLNFLKSNGYEVVYEAYTSKFIEIYLGNESSNLYRRLIITSDYFTESNVADIPNVTIEDYLYKQEA